MAGPAHELSGVCAEDARRGILTEARDSPDACSAFKLVDCGFVVGCEQVSVWEELSEKRGKLWHTVDHTCRAESPHNLCEHVDREFAPWELSVDTIREGDCGVEMGSAYLARLARVWRGGESGGTNPGCVDA